MIATMLPGLLALGVVASALWASFARNWVGCLGGLSLNAALLAAVAWILGAPLMGVAWLLSALGLALAACWIRGGAHMPAVKDRHRRLSMAIWAALISGGVLFAVLIGVDSPIWRDGAAEAAGLAERLSFLAEGLTGRYAPGLVAVVLLALTLLVGVRLWEEA